MSVESEILRIQHNIANTYAAVSEKGGEVPLQPTSANLAAAVASITSSGEMIAGEGLSKEGDTLSVDNPVRGIYTQSEFDALPEAQKASGTYFVGDGGNDAAKLLKIVSNGGFLGLPVGPQGPAGPDGNPIGTIISYMGLTAPKDYLICDGTTYPITDYPDLAAFFQTQFGSKNYFGGDGTTTFAVPDLRNLFLRGYHGGAEEQLSGNIGEKQKGTEFPNIHLFNNGFYCNDVLGQATTFANQDSITKVRESGFTVTQGTHVNAVDTTPTYYTSRPVNMAVLYCIKATESLPAENVYSLDEQVVGRWIDGRPLYRKIYTGRYNVLSNGSSFVVPDSLDQSINTVVNIFANATYLYDNHLTTVPVPHCVVEGNQVSYILINYINTQGIQFFSTLPHLTSALFFITIEYTKTTDQPTIELPAALTTAPAQALFTAAPQSAAAVKLDAEMKPEEV